MVTGALAALQGAYPGYNARDLANVLFATAENIGGQPADNATYGYGLIRLDRATAGPNTLAAGANVAAAAQTTTYWSQPLTTAGGFNVTGPGYLVVAGRTTAAGDVAVNGGALGVDGTLTLQTQMTIGQGGMLTGFGTVVGAVTVGGVLNAGQLPNYADLAANNGGALPAGVPLTGTSTRSDRNRASRRGPPGQTERGGRRWRRRRRRCWTRSMTTAAFRPTTRRCLRCRARVRRRCRARS